MAGRKPPPAVNVAFPATLSADTFEEAIKPLKHLSRIAVAGLIVCGVAITIAATR